MDQLLDRPAAPGGRRTAAVSLSVRPLLQLAAQNEIHAYYEYLDVDCDELFAQAEAYNQTLLSKEDQFVLSDEEEEYISTLLNPMGNGMMGTSRFPKLMCGCQSTRGQTKARFRWGQAGGQLPACPPGARALTASSPPTQVW